MGRAEVTKTFGKRVNAGVSPSLLDDQTCIEVKGCIQRDIGRYTSCWEGQQTDTVNGVTSTFEGLSVFSEESLTAILGANLFAWWDLNDQGNYTLTAGAYDTATDKSGNGYDIGYTSGAAITRPTQGTHAVSGRNYAEYGYFEGLIDYLGVSSGPFDTLGDTGIAIFGVVGGRHAGAYASNFNIWDNAVSAGDPTTGGITIDKVDIGGSYTARTWAFQAYTASGGKTADVAFEQLSLETSGVGENDLSVIGIVIPPTGVSSASTKLNAAGSTDIDVVLSGQIENFTPNTVAFSSLATGELLVTSGNLSDDIYWYIMQFLNERWLVHKDTYPDGVDLWVSAPWRVHHHNLTQRLVASSKTGVGNVAGIAAAIYRGNSEVTQFHEYGDYLIIASDKTPMYAVHKDNIAHATETAGQYATAGNWQYINAPFQIAGKGIHFTHDWHHTGSLDAVASTAAASGSGLHMITGASAWHGGGNISVTGGQGQLHISRRNTDPQYETIPARGYFFSVTSSDNSLRLMDDCGNTQEDAVYRAAVPARWAMGRHPSTYKGRFSYIEGREYNTTRLYAGQAVQVSSWGTGALAIAKDLSGVELNIGDRIILDDKSVLDPIMISAPTREIHTITGVTYGAASTTIYVDGNPTSGLENWWLQRKLTAKERRYIWDCGRPADASRSVITSRDDSDMLFIDPDNWTEWGYDIDGDATARIQQGSNREILSQERALWYRVGDPPIDGVSPPGYRVALLRRGVGIRNDACWCFDSTREKVYFNSPVDNRMYVLLGDSTDEIDDEVKDDPKYTGNFSHVAYHNDRVYCLDTESSTPYIWIYYTQDGTWEGYTVREGCGMNQYGTGTATPPGLAEVGTRATATAYVSGNMVSDGSNTQVCVVAGTSGTTATASLTWAATSGSQTTDGSVTWECYKAQPLYDTAQDGHGGIFAPFTTEDEDDRLLVCFKNTAGNYALRTLNKESDFHSDGRLRHGAKVVPSYSTFKGYPAKLRDLRVTEYGTIYRNGNGVTALNRRYLNTGVSEGEDTGASYAEPEWTDDNSETNRYVFFDNNVSMGNASLGVQYGDGISPIGAVEVLDADVIVEEGRRKG